MLSLNEAVTRGRIDRRCARLLLGFSAVALLLAACRNDAAGPAAVLSPRADAASVVVAANGYTFTTIVDSQRDRFDPFSFGCPAINKSGAIAFRARRLGGATGVFRSTGSALTTIVQNAGSGLGFIGFHPSINDLGDVSFAANRNAGGEVILRGRGGPLTTIAQTQPGVFNFFGFDTSINDSGKVAFKAELDNFDEGLFFGAGAATTTVYLATTSKFQGNDVGPAINRSGQIAFEEDLDTGGSGIFLRSGSSFVTIASTNGPVSSFFRPPSLNNRGVVAFHAFLDAGGEAILKGKGGALTTVATSSGPISTFDFGGPSINDPGLVAFAATLDSGEQGIFVGPDPNTNRVVLTGDMLGGAAATSFVFCREGLNNAGQLAFVASLSDGRLLVIRATPPAT